LNQELIHKLKFLKICVQLTEIRVTNEIGKRYFCNFAPSNRKPMELLYKTLIIKQLGGGKSPLHTFAYPLSKAGPMGSVLDFFCIGTTD